MAADRAVLPTTTKAPRNSASTRGPPSRSTLCTPSTLSRPVSGMRRSDAAHRGMATNVPHLTRRWLSPRHRPDTELARELKAHLRDVARGPNGITDAIDEAVLAVGWSRRRAGRSTQPHSPDIVASARTHLQSEARRTYRRGSQLLVQRAPTRRDRTSRAGLPMNDPRKLRADSRQLSWLAVVTRSVTVPGAPIGMGLGLGGHRRFAAVGSSARP